MMIVRCKCRQLQKKLRSNSGESLVEVLASMLVAALAILMLVQAVSVSAKMIDGSGELMELYYEKGNEVASRAGASIRAEVIITEKGSGAAVDLGLDNTVDCYINDVADGKVISYGAVD